MRRYKEALFRRASAPASTARQSQGKQVAAAIGPLNMMANSSNSCPWPYPTICSDTGGGRHASLSKPCVLHV
jgi:hypothetical protein